MPISIVIILQIFFLFIHAEDTFDCTGYEDDSYHPIFDADDCRHYWHCIYVNTVYMHAVKRICPAGTEFDIAKRQCETASEVDCLPVRSPHLPRTSSTTKAWKWKYSRLFSRINWKPTIPSFLVTRKQPEFNQGQSSEIDLTTMIIPERQTTELIEVLPETTATFSFEQLSKDLHALVLNHHSYKHKSPGAKFFQPGEPENEAELYTSSTKRRTRRTRPTTQLTSIETTITELPLITSLSTTTTATIMTTELTTTATLLTTTTTTPFFTTTPMTTMITQPDTTRQLPPQSRIGGSQRRRSNMTLYILTSDEHKIRQFSVNHTRGILINCNQLRRRLLGRRRVRDASQTTPTHSSSIRTNTSAQIFQYSIILVTIFSCIWFTKLMLE